MRFKLCHQLFLQLPRVGGKRNEKARFRDNTFRFKNLDTFENVGKDFSINLHKRFGGVIK